MVADEHRLEHDAALAAADVEELAHGVVGRWQGDRVAAHLRQRDAAVAGQRMVGPHDGQDRGLLPVLDADALFGRPAVGQADVGIAAQHGDGDLHGLVHAQVELDAWIALAERRNDARQKFDGKARRTGDAHQSTAQPLQALDIRHDPIGL